VVLRASIVAVLLVAASVGIQRASGAESVPPRQPVQSLPLALEGWVGRDLPAWDEKIVALVGADEYINRRYLRSDAVADLYVGYYGSQRQGSMIHSPQNCLPGAGWQPVAYERLSVPADGRTLDVNRYIVQKNLDRQVVLYWFQGRGRAVANEYANRAYLVLDSLRLRRTDGALVRVIAPVLGSVDRASSDAIGFSQQMYPHLTEVIP
jgi:EpsI family protein